MRLLALVCGALGLALLIAPVIAGLRVRGALVEAAPVEGHVVVHFGPSRPWLAVGAASLAGAAWAAWR